ncbi:ATP-binding protein [Streptomyces sp. NPDC005955]|uniref:ATP-binding protein n=1 Tax=Streptomyces sp. NPDC005955 TaxID=3364738 RepID=UPI0036C1D137
MDHAPVPPAPPGRSSGPGRLKVFLGAAPGAGKTCRMLEEAHRRAARGTDVVIGTVDSHGRPRTLALTEGLTALPAAPGAPPGLDLGALLARRPGLALVDDLARANPPGSPHPHRWQDVAALLAAGIDVATTVDVRHLESLSDVVEKITDVAQPERVPDEFVRGADQIELVDVPPDALRRRLVHGDICPPDEVDAALASYVRPGTLTALRQLALLWLADQVDQALHDYRTAHGIGGVWETRERVVVALTGGPEGDTLIRRAARIADRAAGGDLLAVHVTRSDGLAAGSTSHGALARQRRLVESLGGTYHSVVGNDVPTALVEFARAEDATQLVLGTSRRGRVERFLTGRGTGDTIVALSGDIDVHIVTHERAGRGTLLPSRRRTLPPARTAAGPVAGLLLPVLLTLLLDLDAARAALDLTSEALLFLLAVVAVACIGGVTSAVVASVTASLLLNYWFIPPVGRFTLHDANALIALAVFAVVAATVAAVVDRSLRLSRRSARATAEAETLSSLAGSIVRGDATIPALLDRARETFGVTSVELVDTRPAARGLLLADTTTTPPTGTRAPSDPAEEAVTTVAAGPDTRLVLRGRTLAASERRVLVAFAAHAGAAVERDRLARAAAEIEPVRAADRMRTALLRAVGHDLRTPLAAGWAAVTSLRSRDVEFSARDREELLATADTSMARLSALVENLLDLSRLEAGALTLCLRPTALEEVIAPALESLPGGLPTVEVRNLERVPDVLADPPLLERVLANLVANAVRHGPPAHPVLLTASALADRVELRIADRGPGLPATGRERIFEPFQRLGDTDNTSGLGLGLALSRGLTEAMDGTLTPEDTPGGGLTMVLRLPVARSAPQPDRVTDRPPFR